MVGYMHWRMLLTQIRWVRVIANFTTETIQPRLCSYKAVQEVDVSAVPQHREFVEFCGRRTYIKIPADLRRSGVYLVMLITCLSLSDICLLQMHN